MEDVLMPFQQIVESKDYARAISFLNDHKTNFDTGLFQYNRGVLKALNGDLIGARIDLENSLIKGFMAPESIKSLEKVKEDLGVIQLERSDDLADIGHQIANWFDFHAQLSLFFILGMVLIFLWKKLTTRLNKGLIIFFIGLFYFQIFFLRHDTKIAITTREMSLREGPSGIFEPTGSIPEGTKIIYEDGPDNWKKIVSPFVLKGWVNADNFKNLALR